MQVGQYLHHKRYNETFLKTSNNKLINAIKDKYNLTKDQIADLMRLHKAH